MNRKSSKLGLVNAQSRHDTKSRLHSNRGTKILRILTKPAAWNPLSRWPNGQQGVVKLIAKTGNQRTLGKNA